MLDSIAKANFLILLWTNGMNSSGERERQACWTRHKATSTLLYPASIMNH